MRDEVERKVERADRADDPDRTAQREGELPLTGLGGVHRHHLAGKLPRFHGGERVRRHRPRGLHTRRLQRLAGLVGDHARDLLVAAAETCRDANEDLCTLVCGQRVLHRPLCRVDRAARFLSARFCHTPDDVAGVGRAHLEPVARVDPLTADEQALFIGCSDHEASLDRMQDALIIDAVRSPIGRKNGSLASIRGDELCAQVLNGLVARHDLDPGEIEDVQLGCVTQIGEQGWNLGRMVPLVAGWPETVAGTTVDRQCGSSMQTNFNAATAIWSGQLDLVVSAGVEMMSRVPMGSNGGDLSDKLLERWQIVPQGISAEVIADEWGLSREDLDSFALESHRRAIAASDDGRFEDEIVPIDLTNPHTGVVFGVDETPRRDTSLEALAALKPAFLPEGKVTAGSSSQICDGAAGVLVASERIAARLGLEPRARFVSFGLSGVDPYRMLHGNPQACDSALARAGLTWDDIAVIEVNEAFASVVLQFARDARLEDRWDDINPNGGGISLGHPLGATGARITATLLNELERRQARYGIATMCIGFGQAIACIVERV